MPGYWLNKIPLRIRIEDGAIVTIGATTFILRAAEQESL